jgi:ribonuclease D
LAWRPDHEKIGCSRTWGKNLRKSAQFPFSGCTALFYIQRVIDTDQKLGAFLPEMRAAKWIALDTEADSLHAYPEKLCLIQVSIEGQDELLDPLSSMNLVPAFEVFRDHELILHGADYDLRLLRKGRGFVPTAIFDTMLAGRLLGSREFGLTNLVAKYVGVTLEKGPQKANWAQRPLTQRMIDYARNDTRYLKPLADILSKELRAKGRLDWHREWCRSLIDDCAQIRSTDPEVVWRVKGSHRLNPPALGVLREIWHWRETEAVAANKPPYFVLSPETMVDLAEAAVEARPVKDILPRRMSTRRQQGIVRAIETGIALDKHPGVIRSAPYRQTEPEKKRMLELERRRDRRAAELGIDPTLIASRAMLVLLAKDWETHQAELMSWQRELLSS